MAWHYALSKSFVKSTSFSKITSRSHLHQIAILLREARLVKPWLEFRITENISPTFSFSKNESRMPNLCKWSRGINNNASLVFSVSSRCAIGSPNETFRNVIRHSWELFRESRELLRFKVISARGIRFVRGRFNCRIPKDPSGDSLPWKRAVHVKFPNNPVRASSLRNHCF